MRYPNQEQMEIPLLKALVDHGGFVFFSVAGDALEEELANEFGLTQEERDFTSPEIKAKGNRKWRNHIQYVRLHLVDKGHIYKGIHDKWEVTPEGYKRLGLTPPERAKFQK